MQVSCHCSVSVQTKRIDRLSAQLCANRIFINQNKISDLKLIDVNYKISYLKLIDVNCQIYEYKSAIPFYCFSTCLSLKSIALTTFVLNSKIKRMECNRNSRGTCCCIQIFIVLSMHFHVL